ncbi:major histocompatibility complex class I-related gene protein-like [Carassius gibelio]|uniref:major histocompatibility complex class I-related gene protein-like n=1 Tax=Carassius gibelio TaxID=101364 RepID=UPI0022779B4C|nr:major histocompatibility complex class I-related gene protein-like [Carassius gibelio]
MEGDSVTLNTSLTELINDDLIQWRFGIEITLLAEINKRADLITVYDDAHGGRFRNRLKLNNQTGSLTITNTRTEDTGRYLLLINHTSIIFSLIVFELKSVSVKEGNSVTLNSGLTEMKDDDVILWTFGIEFTLLAEINKRADSMTVYDDVLDGRFRDRLKLNNQTGSLTITNTTTQHAGVYVLWINQIRIYLFLIVYQFHTFTTLYTEINGIAGIPASFAVATLDGRQIDYYDSEMKKLIPRQDWMKEFMSGDRFKEYAEIRERVQQTNKINITVLMQQFNQTRGVHTYQRMYGCEWDDQTGASQGFDQYGYDGEDYVALDVKALRYITPVPQGVITTEKWNNDTAQLELFRQYYQRDCVPWLKHFLTLRKVDLETRAPVVSLLQRHPSSPVVCHATGFYPPGLTITWLKNGQDHDEDVDVGELLPNEDGTFQKTSTLSITPEVWEKNQFDCMVEHEGKTFRKTADEIKKAVHCCGFTEAVIRLVLSALVGVATVILLVYGIRSS